MWRLQFFNGANLEPHPTHAVLYNVIRYISRNRQCGFGDHTKVSCVRNDDKTIKRSADTGVRKYPYILGKAHPIIPQMTGHSNSVRPHWKYAGRDSNSQLFRL